MKRQAAEVNYLSLISSLGPAVFPDVTYKPANEIYSDSEQASEIDPSNGLPACSHLPSDKPQPGRMTMTIGKIYVSHTSLL
ncbi:hypothetical protein PtB15_7B539 [Puccinia triticina]|nr:hypothetical protein PtB15_7B539 [Puccinia triticina]